jgi:hypothetical protein
VLCGHFHQQITGQLSGVPTWVTPGVYTRIDHLTEPVTVGLGEVVVATDAAFEFADDRGPDPELVRGRRQGDV